MPGRGANRRPSRSWTARPSGVLAEDGCDTETLALTAGPIRLAGAAPLSAFERYVGTPLTTANGIAEVLLSAIPPEIRRSRGR